MRSTNISKDQGLARQVPRDQLTTGTDGLGVPPEEHVMNVVEGLRVVQEEMGS